MSHKIYQFSAIFRPPDSKISPSFQFEWEPIVFVTISNKESFNGHFKTLKSWYFHLKIGLYFKIWTSFCHFLFTFQNVFWAELSFWVKNCFRKLIFGVFWDEMDKNMTMEIIMFWIIARRKIQNVGDQEKILGSHFGFLCSLIGSN